MCNRSSRDLLEKNVWMNINVKVPKINVSRFGESVITSVNQLLMRNSRLNDSGEGKLKLNSWWELYNWRNVNVKVKLSIQKLR